MERRGTADLPLHGGHAPRWLFDRMEKLSGAIAEYIIEEHSREEFLRRLADPHWFQAFGCVLGFDWHSSGLTTTTMGALKEALDPEEHGILIAGGKGNASRETPDELVAAEEYFNHRTRDIEWYQRSSRLSAAVDNSCLQDTYQLYHHTFILTEGGNWSVIQQGMNDNMARRYHWTSGDFEEFVEEPHSGIAAMRRESSVLNLTSTVAEETREISVDLVQDNPARLKKYLKPANQTSLDAFTGGTPHHANQERSLSMPTHHEVDLSVLSERSIDQLDRAYEAQPDDFEELVDVPGIGEASLRALALISELVHGSENSWEDPAKYSYAHGGKDGTPHPVEREKYDRSIEYMKQALSESDVDSDTRQTALKRLSDLMNSDDD